MKKLLFLVFAGALLTITSCSKNQKAVKLLDGKWELTTIDGVAAEQEDVTITTYEKCKLKKDDYCDAVIKYDDGTSESFTYQVTDKGETLKEKVDVGGISIELTSEIMELTKDKLKTTTTLEGFDPVVNEFKKI